MVPTHPNKLKHTKHTNTQNKHTNKLKIMQTNNQNTTFTCRICFEEYQCDSSVHNYNAYKYYGCCKDCIISSIKLNGSQPIDIQIGYTELLQICENIDEFVELADIYMQKTIQTDPILRELMEKRNEKKPYLTPKKLIYILCMIYRRLYHSTTVNEIVVTPYPNTSLSTQIKENADELVKDIKETIVSTLKDCYSFNDLKEWIYWFKKSFVPIVELYTAFNGLHLVKRAVIELCNENNTTYMDIAQNFATKPLENMISEIIKFIDAKNNEEQFINEVELSFEKYRKPFDTYQPDRCISFAEMYVKKMKEDRSNIGICECGHGIIIKESHICTSCNQVSCDKCLKIITNGQKHVCSKEDLELVKYYHSHCKNCPKCGTWIEKSSGCNDMFCTECHSLFDFVTGERKYGNLHNPERMEYLERIGHQDDRFNYTLDEIEHHISEANLFNINTLKDQTITKFIQLANKIIGFNDTKPKYIYATYDANQVPRLTHDSFKAISEIRQYGDLFGLHHIDSSRETPLESTLVKQYSFFMINSDEKFIKILYGMSYIWNYEKERRIAMDIIGPKICALSQMLIRQNCDINQIKEFIMNTCKEIDEKVGGSHIQNTAVKFMN